jgi:adenylosuccinate lyase
MDEHANTGLDQSQYEDIVKEKYSSKEMRELFSERNVILNWRRCWVALAVVERDLGLKVITKEMVQEMKDNMENIDLEAARKKEQEVKHDVVAQIYAYGLVCPKAKGIIHLGATSQYVKCNTDMILNRQALNIIRKKLLLLIKNFDGLIDKYKTAPTLGYTHYQPAQPLTIGRRFCVYAQDFLSDFEELDRLLNNLQFRGAKGATGTQDSFVELFDGDKRKVMKLDVQVSRMLGFEKIYPITSQTYTRKQDIYIMNVMANIAATAKKFATDMRLMSNLNILEEPFTEKQVGSSAMPYKRNPMRSERVCSLARKVMSNLADFYNTYSEQWLERTLDDSAIRRIDIPQNFMLVEYIIDSLTEITSGLVVYPMISKRLLDQELPFMATEKIIMATVKKGADRQQIHEILREHAFNLAKHIKMDGGDNNLIEMLANDARIGLSRQELENILDVNKFLGMSVEQSENFLKNYLRPVLRKNKVK